MGSLAEPRRIIELHPENLGGKPGGCLQVRSQHLFLFSDQVDLINDRAWTRRLSSNYTLAEQYANTLAQTEKTSKLVEQTPVKVWVEALNEFHIKGGF